MSDGKEDDPAVMFNLSLDNIETGEISKNQSEISENQSEINENQSEISENQSRPTRKRKIRQSSIYEYF